MQETGTNESGTFDNGIWGGQIQFGEGGGITPSDNNIVLTATDSDNPAKTGNVTMTTSGGDFGTTMGASVEGAQDGAEVGTSGEAIGGEGVTNEGGAPVVEGEQAVQGEQANAPATNPWKNYLPWTAGAVALIFVGGGITWWIRRRGGGNGGGSISSLLFSTLKTAATKVRLFFW